MLRETPPNGHMLAKRNRGAAVSLKSLATKLLLSTAASTDPESMRLRFGRSKLLASILQSASKHHPTSILKYST
jgi:hypothetical protein